MSEEQNNAEPENQIVAALDDAKAVEPVDENESPVIALGHSVGFYYFISPVGQQRALKYNEFTYNGILSLFEGDVEWLEKNFPRTAGRRKSVEGFDVDVVTQWLMTSCRNRGLYDATIPVRKAGVWLDETPDEGGLPRLVVHSGNALLISGKTERPGQIIGGAFYESAPKIQPIGDKAATEEEAKFVLETLKLWNYARGETDALLLFGFIGQAMLGAAPSWRVHAMVTAPSGSGKTSLSNMIATAFGSGAHDIKNNFTEAGLRQSLTNEARCMMLDEAEAEENGGGRVMKVIELLRHMAGGKGSSGVRGSSGGQSQSFTVTGCAYMASILHVPLKPQDKNRILNIRLKPFDENFAGADMHDLEKRLKKMKKLSPALRRRMVDGWNRFLGAFESYHPAFVKAGLSSRSADHMATLYAAKEVMLHDAEICSDTIDEEIYKAADVIAALKEQSKDNEGLQCLTHLYSSTAEVWRDGGRLTVGQLIAAAIAKNDKSENKRLGPFGIRFEPAKYDGGENRPDCLIIANESVGLDKMFAGTRWAGGVWSQAFQYLGAELSGTKRFAGAPARGMIIPKEHWPRDDE